MRILEGYVKGVNLGGWLSQCGRNYNEEHYNTFITEKDIDLIASWGLDHVRLPVDYNVVQEENGDFIESGFRHIDDCIRWCEARNLKIVLEKEKNIGLDPEELKKKKCEFEQKKNESEKIFQTMSDLMSAYESKLPANLRSKRSAAEVK